MDRRTFVSTVASVLFTGLVPRTKAFAQNAPSGYIQFSPTVALDIAERFLSCTNESLGASPEEPIPMFDVSGDLKGYCIPYSDTLGEPNGYLLLDIDCSGLISQFSIQHGVQDIYSALSNTLEATERSFALGPNPSLIYIDPFSYALPDETMTQAFAIDQALPLAIKTESALRTRSIGNDTWWNVWISYSDAYSSQYVLGSEEYAGDLRYVTEAQAEQATNSYACGPHALYCIGASIPNASYTDFLIPDPWNDWGEYQSLWSYSNTRITGYNGNIRLGTTNSSDLANGFRNYCGSKGLSVQASYSTNISFASFVSQINQRRLAIVGAGINTPDGESGHFMAVNGYTTLMRTSDKKLLQCLSIFNGWSDMVYFNYDFARFTWLGGIFPGYRV